MSFTGDSTIGNHKYGFNSNLKPMFTPLMSDSNGVLFEGWVRVAGIRLQNLYWNNL